jgi:NAD(P)-dependent dehydrogenase (short-subunit alcohol dehydrogenase family)
MTFAREDAVMAAPVVSVTGVSRGIGRAIAPELQFRGAAVVGAERWTDDPRKRKVYKGASHGLCTTHKDPVNEDLLAFLRRRSA